MNLKPPAPLNSLVGVAYMIAFVVIVIVAYRKLAPKKVQTLLPV